MTYLPVQGHVEAEPQEQQSPKLSVARLDIDVRLFLDSNCFDPYDELLLLDDGCYANLYTNATKAFKVRIVGFVEPFKYDIQDYTDACHTIFSPKRTLESGKCERFIGGYWAEITNRLRSSTCVVL
ncbi:hypothetical protein AK812_SmicGene43250, partial [Symbiodinium microadriaticum]